RIDTQNGGKSPNESLGLSALVVGSGYGGLSIENASRAIVQGVQNANDKIAKLKEDSGPAIDKLEFIELFEDVAMSCFYSMYKIAAEEDRQLNIDIGKQIISLQGRR